MKLSLHALAVPLFVSRLRTLSELLGRGEQHAREQQLAPALLVEARLTPDMFTLAQQVQLACHYAEDATARLVGRPPPAIDANPDRTFRELEARVARTIEALEEVPESAFDGAEDRAIELPLGPDLVLSMRGLRYLQDWAVPHFYFHLVTAYDILRHKGVAIGKRDFMPYAGDAIHPRTAARA